MSISTVLSEKRIFPPSEEFKALANLKERPCIEDIPKFWEAAAKKIYWAEPWERVLDWNSPHAQWFVGGKTNASVQCLDEQIRQGRAKKVAFYFESESGETATYSYERLHQEVCQLSNFLEQDLKLKAGDRAAIYMPLIPEAVVAMLACARIGVTHSVIFAGFSANSVRDRVIDAQCKIIFTTDYSHRKGQKLNLKNAIDEVAKEANVVEKVLFLRRDSVSSLQKKDLDWKECVAKKSIEHTAKAFDSEHPLFVLYTSGTTGKPKGILHTTGGYLVHVHQTADWVFDLKLTDRYWCTADIGWITGHSYLVYGMLSNGATLFFYEGVLNHPKGKIWELIDRYQITTLYTAPTAIRGFMREGDEVLKKYSLNSLRLLGSVGEPINPEAWMWYYEKIGKKKCPIIDTWWQTETGGMLITAMPAVTPLKPGSATLPLPGILADIVDEEGNSCKANQGGYLVLKHPWPGMARTILNDAKRFEETYWSKYPGIYFTGDGACRDEDGYFWIKGRIDDVLNVSGHRLGTMEIESAIVSFPGVAEAAVVGKPDELKGEAVVAYVTPKENFDTTEKDDFTKRIKAHVAQEIGAIARPDLIILTKTLPKTRSGKIMRRLLKDHADGKELKGDTSTLENQNLIEVI